MSSDISNAYLEAYNGDPIVFVAGPEFGDLEGHTMIVIKALYGLSKSGRAWSERLAAILRTEGWVPCRADHDVWMKQNGDHQSGKVLHQTSTVFRSKWSAFQHTPWMIITRFTRYC